MDTYHVSVPMSNPPGHPQTLYDHSIIMFVHNVDALRRRPSEQRPCQREHPAYEHKFEQKKPASAVFVVLKCLVSALLVSLLVLQVIREYASLFLSSWISTINIGLA